jgi:predicted GIY-YIG superfamily endonuclease
MSGLIIYALKLEKGKYYVGKTDRFEGAEMRFHEHLFGRGCEWTRMYKPISIIETYEHYSTFEEDVLTKKYMLKYGIENVRGGSYTKIDLEEWQVKSLEHEFKSVNDNCGKGQYSEYLSKFETEKTIEEEITRLENVRTKIRQLHTFIFHYKYLQIVNEKKETIAIEIEPSIIHSYNMRSLEWNRQVMLTVINNPVTKLTNEILYNKLLTYKGDGNKAKIVDDENVVENIYKIYIYRKRLEREYLELFNNENNSDTTDITDITTTDALVKIINNKMELLYEKLAKMI